MTERKIKTRQLNEKALYYHLLKNGYLNLRQGKYLKHYW